MTTRREWLSAAISGLGLATFARGGEKDKVAKKGRIFAYLGFQFDRNTIGVYAIEPDDGTWVKVGDDRMNPAARVAPDGKTIAWLKSNREGAYDGVFVVDTFGGESRKLTEKAGRIAWSPDGSELIVSMGAAEVGESKAQPGTWRVDVKTGRETKLPIAEPIQVIDWSADGKTLLALEDGDGKKFMNRPLIALDVSGEHRRVLVDDDGVVFGEHFSPDGRRVFFTRYLDKNERLVSMEAWSIAPDGSKREPVFDHLEGNRDPFHLRSAPDGERFAAILWGWVGGKNMSKTYRPGPEESLYLIDRAGKSIRQIELPPTILIRLIDWR